MTGADPDPQGVCDICGKWHYYIYCEYCTSSIKEYEVMRRLHALATVAALHNNVNPVEIRRATMSVINIVEGAKDNGQE